MSQYLRLYSNNYLDKRKGLAIYQSASTFQSIYVAIAINI